MRISILTIALLFCFTFSHAQTTKTTFALDENSVIKDSTGRRISKIEFYDAIVSGNYQFKPVKDKSGNIVEYILIRCERKESNVKVSYQSSSSQCAPSTVLAAGQLAPDLAGMGMNDTAMYDLNYYKGRKVVVLNFWFAKCVPCVAEMPALNRVKARYKDRADIVFIAPTFETQKNIETFLTQHPFNYNILPEAFEAIKNYKAISYPLNVVIGYDGRIAYVSAGGLDAIEFILDKKIRDQLGLTKDMIPTQR